MTQIRKDILTNDQYYHIFSRSISKYIIFNNSHEYNRIIELLNLYRYVNFSYKYSQFIELEVDTRLSLINNLKNDNEVLVEIVAYCIMPTHIHLILKQITDNGITKYLGRVLNSYSRYFNTKHKRNGPLWSGRFKNVLIENDEQLLHLTRYIHLNPTSAKLCLNPEDWNFSSYTEYVNPDILNKICSFSKIVNIDPNKYRIFINDRKSYQQNLSVIKNILLDDYTG